MEKYPNIVLAVLGIALAVIPFISDCASQGNYMTGAMGVQMPMRCYDDRLPELAIGIPIFALGAIMTFARFKSKAALFPLSVLVALLGGAAILMPTAIIGTCPNPVMTCNTVMKPALVTLGSLVIVSGLAGMVLARRLKS